MKTRNKLFRLGIYCLVLLMITALLLVGGSFSKFTLSSSDVSGIPSLTVARLTKDDIEVTPLDPTDDVVAKLGLGGKHVILYAFTITNNSEVPVTCVLDFLPHIDEVSGLDAKDLTGMKVLLYVGGGKFTFYEDGFAGNENADINVSTDEKEYFLDASGGEITCAIVLDFYDCVKTALADTLYISPCDSEEKHESAISLTVKQAKAKEGSHK